MRVGIVCGICGRINHSYEDTVDEAVLHKMVAVLMHRGPDDEGMYIYKNVGLAHRRLSVIDISMAGRQPMSNEDGSVWIVFNGEIYNFLELRIWLQKKGHVFTSHTDTEVILHLYEEKGVECVHDLRGMFAFAIWDSSNQRLFLARDRVGKKPLVYTVNERGLLFASEIKSLLCDPSVNREVDHAALHHYLTYQYIPSPFTIFKEVRKLPPAHVLIYERGNIMLRRYWTLSYRSKLRLPSLEAYGEHFLELFEESIKIRLRSDVPLGAFLSGGIDSSLVVATMSRLLPYPVKTFSIGFDQEDYNELHYAKIVAQKFNTEHHEFIVKPDAVAILPRLVWYYNEPFADSSAVPTYYVSKMTREYVTVALSGDGGDELFAGYQRYVADRLASYYKLLPPLLREQFVNRLIGLFPDSDRSKGFLRRLKRFLKGISELPERRYVRWLCFFDNEMKQELYTPQFKEQVGHLDSVDLIVEWYRKADGPTFIDKTLFVDVMSYLPEDLLVKVDIASMANSLEVRSPFLDHKLMEFAASLPSDLKLRGVRTKYLLKRTLSRIIPHTILSRRKMGFGVPLDVWFRRELREMMYDTLLDRIALQRGYFRKEVVQKMLEEHLSGSFDHSYRLWALLILELWQRQFVDGDNVPVVRD